MLSTSVCVAHEKKVKDKMMTSSGLLIAGRLSFT